MLFSIVITCYNQASFIQEAIHSALRQGYGDKEVVVVDDGSTDGSSGVIEQFGEAIVFVPLKQNAGPAEERNAGAERARGKFLVFLDGDDLLLPWALTSLEAVLRRKNAVLILCRMRWFHDSLAAEEIGSEPTALEVVEYSNFMEKDRAYRASASAMVIERAAFNTVEGWSKGIFPMDDHDLLIKLGYSGRAVQILSPPTTCYRVHSSNTVHQIDRMISNLHKLLEREKLRLYPGQGLCAVHRQAILGGLVLFALKNAFRHGLYGEASKLALRAWPTVAVAALLRAFAYLRGRRPVERLDLSRDSARAGEGAATAGRQR